jgi:hypothetical protein
MTATAWTTQQELEQDHEDMVDIFLGRYIVTPRLPLPWLGLGACVAYLQALLLVNSFEIFIQLH